MVRKKRPTVEVIDFSKLPKVEKLPPTILPNEMGVYHCHHCGHWLNETIVSKLQWRGMYQVITCVCGARNRVFY